MTDEQLKALEERIFSTIHAHTKSLAAMKMLMADNERLRALIKDAETADGSNEYALCPWCGCDRSEGGTGVHRDDCPAFTPDGAVR